MTPRFQELLRARKATIHDRWQTLLRVEPVSGPLANPEALQYLIPEVWRQLLANLAKSSNAPSSLPAARAQVPACSCGHNPYRAFFMAAEQALTEAAVHIQAAQSIAERSEAELAELIHVIRSMACQEIDTFCSACVHHGLAARCRFVAA